MDIVRRQFGYLSVGNTEDAPSVWAPEAPNDGRKVVRAGLLRVYDALRSQQEKHTLHETVAEGDWVAIRTTCAGAHSASPAMPVNSGIFTGVKPTGRTYQVQRTHLLKAVNGQTSEHDANRDDPAAAIQVSRTLRAPPG